MLNWPVNTEYLIEITEKKVLKFTPYVRFWHKFIMDERRFKKKYV